jgi:hypothetical protein
MEIFSSIFGVLGIILSLMLFRAAFRIEQHLGRIADCLERQPANKWR